MDNSKTIQSRNLKQGLGYKPSYSSKNESIGHKIKKLKRQDLISKHQQEDEQQQMAIKDDHVGRTNEKNAKGNINEKMCKSKAKVQKDLDQRKAGGNRLEKGEEEEEGKSKVKDKKTKGIRKVF